MSKRKRISNEVISGIYKIENIINKKVYVGSSKDIYGRWVQHKNGLEQNKHHSKHLQMAWNKYGSESFKFDIIELVKEEFLLEKEQEWYNYYNSGKSEFGYNMFEIARIPSNYATLDKLKDGCFNINIDDFYFIIDCLINTELSIPKISKLIKVSKRTIYQIYYHKNYSLLTKDMVFKKRTYVTNNKLDKKDVYEIISLLLNNEYSGDIAKAYEVHTNTIDDIYYHRTWNSLTSGIEFPIHTGRYNRPTTKSVIQYDLNNNYIATYESAREAEKETGIGFRMISRVCNGDRLSTHEYIFKFAS